MRLSEEVIRFLTVRLEIQKTPAKPEATVPEVPAGVEETPVAVEA
jgi:hypothetical protein